MDVLTLLRIISGARYSGVPQSVHVLPLTTLAKPKSVSWNKNKKHCLGLLSSLQLLDCSLGLRLRAASNEFQHLSRVTWSSSSTSRALFRCHVLQSRPWLLPDSCFVYANCSTSHTFSHQSNLHIARLVVTFDLIQLPFQDQSLWFSLYQEAVSMSNKRRSTLLFR